MQKQILKTRVGIADQIVFDSILFGYKEKAKIIFMYRMNFSSTYMHIISDTRKENIAEVESFN